MKINVFGSSISALVCAGCLAESGNQVVLIGHRDNETIEPGLVKLLDAQIDAARLSIESQFDVEADFQILSLNANQCQEAKIICAKLAHSTNKDMCLVIRSSFTMGTIKQLSDIAKTDCLVNPDFASEGQAIQAFTRPDRIIIGSSNPQNTRNFKRLFAPFNRNQDVIIEMSEASAELTKYATNAMLATRISLMNELAIAAEHLGADIEEVRLGLGADKRIGSSFLYAGIGFGGTHFGEDLNRIQALINATGARESLLESVITINEQQKELLFRKLWQHFDCQIEHKTIAIWGVSYKPNSNSIEGAPSLALIKAFVNQGCQLKIFDPMLDVNFMIWMKETLSLTQQAQVEICADMYEATQQADALCVVTEWKPFWSPNLVALKENMATPILLDGRNLYDKQWIEHNGFTYFGVGR
ncbi:MAG: UDP-glucose/GDP-mannose dehydrogenase family protein [Gammaproteobacteria bacterium]|nr:UDP-glucose/GDP-mannose dehydrogenase family protein [Gammaproteobacteria bacterium]